MIPGAYTLWSGFIQSRSNEPKKKGNTMRIEGESYGIDVGTFVMNYHHGLLRLGVVETKKLDDNGAAHYEVKFFEDHIHQAKVEWEKKLNSKRVHSNTIRGCYLKPVSPEWLRNVAYAYRRYEDERRTENG